MTPNQQDRNMSLSPLLSRRLRYDRPVEELTDEELDRHMDITHDRDSGERGLNWNTNPPSLRRYSAVRVHRQLHDIGVWSAIPHHHGGTLPFLSWQYRLEMFRRRWQRRLRQFTGGRIRGRSGEGPQQSATQAETPSVESGT